MADALVAQCNAMVSTGFEQVGCLSSIHRVPYPTQLVKCFGTATHLS